MDPFPTTRWSLFEAVETGDPLKKRAALELIITRYSPALKRHIVRHRLAATSDADDLLNDFLADRILDSNLLERADKSQGRFRNLIRTVLSNYARDRIRRSNASHRSPESIASLSTIAEDATENTNTPDRDFDRDWGKQVVSLAIKQMELECIQVDRPDLWEVFDARLLKPIFNNEKPVPISQIVREFGSSSNSQVSNLLVTSKRMFGRVVRDVLSEYVFTGREVEDEIKDLFIALSGPTTG